VDVTSFIKPEDRLTHAIEVKDLEGVRAALRAGSDPNRADKDDLPPLHLAATRGFVEAGKALLENHADVNLMRRA